MKYDSCIYVNHQTKNFKSMLMSECLHAGVLGIMFTMYSILV